MKMAKMYKVLDQKMDLYVFEIFCVVCQIWLITLYSTFKIARKDKLSVLTTKK